MNATIAGGPDSGSLNEIVNCAIYIYGVKIKSRILPDISDSKGATYTDEAGIGRTMPFKSYQASENRTIQWTAHYVVTKKSDINEYLDDIKRIQSAVYPRNSKSIAALDPPFFPPVICQLSCGSLLKRGISGTAGTDSPYVNAVMKTYSIKYDTSVPWDKTTLLPYKFDIDMTFEVVYDQSALPGAESILGSIG